MKILLVILLFLFSCEKSDTKVNCFKCYTNNTQPEKPAYDTCVLDGQRSYRDENFNCYEIK